MSLDIEDFESYLKMKYVETNKDVDKYTTETMSTSLFMKLVEEIGEVAEALNKMNGRKQDDGESQLAFELADVIHYTMAIAAINDINIEEAILMKDRSASIRYHQSPNLEEYLSEINE